MSIRDMIYASIDELIRMNAPHLITSRINWSTTSHPDSQNLLIYCGTRHCYSISLLDYTIEVFDHTNPAKSFFRSSADRDFDLTDSESLATLHQHLITCIQSIPISLLEDCVATGSSSCTT